MPQPLDDPVLAAFAIGTMLLSIATGLYLIYAHSLGPILPYVPRRPVPWGPVAAALAVLYVVTALSSALPRQASPKQDSVPNAASPEVQDVKVDSLNVGEQLLVSMAPQVLIVIGFVFVIAVFFKATPRDLGLPATPHEFSHEVFIGVVAGLAALAPIHLIQGLLMYLMNMQEQQSGHPLVKMVTDGEPSVTVMVLASLAAVVVAPICEETAFRLLLQGWLEKWEDERLSWCAEPSPDAAAGDDVQSSNANAANDEARMTNDGYTGPDDSSFVIRHSSLAVAPVVGPPSTADPPPRGVAGLPYGWLPILVSSVLFGLAHLGYGPEPVPLFFLALFLGYLYHRTHRIVPCIVCHAVFNLFTMFALWRMVFHGTH